MQVIFIEHNVIIVLYSFGISIDLTRVYVWIDGTFDGIMLWQCNFSKNYTLELQQSHGASVIWINSLTIQTCHAQSGLVLYNFSG